MGFFTFLAGATKFSLCFCNWIKNGKHDSKKINFTFLIVYIVFTMATVILLGNFSVLFESSSRVTEYAIFTYPRSLEGLWDLLEKLKLVKSIPYGREILYGLSIATALVLYKRHKDEMPHSYQSLIKFIFGINI